MDWFHVWSFLIGMCLGACAGVIVAGILASAKRADEQIELMSRYYREKAKNDKPEPGKMYKVVPWPQAERFLRNPNEDPRD